jgi:hypothetical protein
MSHFMERLIYLSRKREPLADGHSELRDVRIAAAAHGTYESVLS